MADKVPMPWDAIAFDAADCIAFAAFRRGQATEGQQKRVFSVLVEKICRVGDLSFRPGIDGERATAFAEGKRSVGLEVVKLTRPETATGVRRKLAVKNEAKE